MIGSRRINKPGTCVVAGRATLRLSAAVFGMALGQAMLPMAAVQAAVAGTSVALAPHRAVYEIKLDRTASGSGIRELTGRMVYELTGSVCEGYTQNMRFVTSSVGRKGVRSIADMRSSTWEGGSAKRFRFNSSQYQNQKLLDRVRGDASRNPGSKTIRVKLSKPKTRQIKLSSDIYFPVQHSIALLQAAKDGKSVLQADIYDGTDSGDKVFATTTIIGPELSPAADARLPAVKNTSDLGKMKVWPVSISYFEKGEELSKRNDGLPMYELAFRFYANGVSRRLFIDYGDFAVRGVLSKLTYFKASKCSGDKSTGKTGSE